MEQNTQNTENAIRAEFANVYKQNFSKVFNFIRSKYNKDNFNLEEIEDITQDAFTRAYIAITNGKYKEKCSIIGYIMTIANNTYIDKRRKGGDITVLPFSYFEFVNKDGELFSTLNLESNNPNPLEKFIRKEEIQLYKKFLPYLPEKQAKVVELRRTEFSYKEIVEIVGTNSNTALGDYRYATMKLKKFLKNY